MAFGYGIDQLRKKNLFDSFGNYNAGMGFEDDSSDITPEPSLWSESFPVSRMDVPTVKPSGNMDVLNQPSTPDTEEEDPNDPYGILKMLNKFPMQTSANDRFNAFLRQFPQEQDPSFMRKMTASMAGFKGGPEASNKILHDPYNRDLEKWKAQVEPLGKAADIERQGNITERQLFGNVATTTIAAKRQEAQNRIAEEKNRIQEEKNKASEKVAILRNNVNRMKAEGWTFDTKGPEIIAMRTKDGRPETIMTGVKTGELGDLELENLRGEWGVKKAEATGMNAIDAIAARGEQARLTKETAPGRTNTPKMNIDQRKEMEQEIYRTDPAAKKFFKVNSDGTVTLKPPPVAGSMPWSWSEADVTKYNQIMKQLYPDNPNIPTPGKQNIGPGTTTTTPGKKQAIGPTQPSIQNPAAGQFNEVKLPGNPNMRVRTYNATGHKVYSTDGGKTWSPNKPGSVPSIGAAPPEIGVKGLYD
jgi:hypothetical protein